MKIDITKSIEENILALYNEVNPNNILVAGAATFSAPVVEVPEGDVFRNTKLTLTATAASGMIEGSTVNIAYARLPLNSGNANDYHGDPGIISSDDEAAVLAKFAAALKLIPSELVSSNYTAATGDEQGSITIGFKTDSLLYVDTPKAFSFSIPTEQKSFADSTQETNMNGFETNYSQVN